jgi:hypothetical protein
MTLEQSVDLVERMMCSLKITNSGWRYVMLITYVWGIG